MRLLRSTAVIGILTMGSRVLGLVREMLLAAALGAGPVAEAFVVAFRFPNLFRRFFAEGAFNSAFVPLYSRRMEAEGEDSARNFAREVMSVLLVTLGVLTIAAELAMPWIMRALAPGFLDDPGKFELTVLFTQITMPYLMLMSLTAMLGGVLNAHGKFGLAAAAPILLNIVLIAVLVTAPESEADTGLRLTIGVTASGVLQAALLWWGCKRAGIGFPLRWPRLTPGVKRLIVLGVPGAIAAGVTQINITISQIIASLQDGAVALLYYADRLYQLPLGVIGIAMGVALLPALSKRLGAGDEQGAANAMNRALEISMGLTLPATIALIVMPNFLVEGLFMRGAFTGDNAAATALAVQAFAVGLPAFVLIKVFSPGFFAREDTATPMRYAAISMVVNIAVGAGLFFLIRETHPGLGHVGLAAATSVAGWLNALMLGWQLARRGGLSFDKRLIGRLPSLTLSAVAMGGFVAYAASQADLITTYTFDSRFLAVFAVAAAGLAVYGVFALLTRAIRISELRDAFARG
ncbi:murein biosynthesis integral membrane protein MurJ [Hyphobacterium marinum]|uniref:Probable lipid II flippase MurJ n=1 Tax=Hyphobacterium marinum TaxID=3116574 RepID=A0ABU7LV35_9PROT|nr:murein biosynthesis integral membrane protein MurJ [Hyphobacterium sp. Y6023]MEE2565429.1 murein biosynthesis integral membrane protein MurJ [Hyphobacterium sp. Y6023]